MSEDKPKENPPLDKTKHPGGRPTAYKPEYCELVIEDATRGYSLGSFAALIGVARDTLTEWQHVHPEFSSAVKRAHDIRLRRWESRAGDLADWRGPGGTGAQTAMTIFMLKNYDPQQFRDRHEVDVSGKITLEALLTKADELEQSSSEQAQVEDQSRAATIDGEFEEKSDG